ncbi:transposase [Streptomyces erythrochromogenes]|uniref:transposase n=1 Tax=Streptomyces erythrochromogenes TaxID=285574 RepID=UPI003695568F
MEPLLLTNNNRCGRWRDHRQVINGILHRVRTGVQWRDLPERYGRWKTARCATRTRRSWKRTKRASDTYSLVIPSLPRQRRAAAGSACPSGQEMGRQRPVPRRTPPAAASLSCRGRAPPW